MFTPHLLTALFLIVRSGETVICTCDDELSIRELKSLLFSVLLITLRKLSSLNLAFARHLEGFNLFAKKAN